MSCFLEKENKKNFLSNINKVIFVGKDMSIYKSLKNLSDKTNKFILKSTPYNSTLLKSKDLILLDDTAKNFKKILSELQKNKFTNLFLIINSLNIDVLEKKNYKAFLKPLRIFELYKEILKKIHNNYQSNHEWKLDRRKLQFYIKNRSISLTEKEYYFLKYLLDNRENIVSKEQLLKEVWSYNLLNPINSSDIRVVETLVSKIRKKLGVIKNSPKIVKFKEGYQILI